MANYAPYGQLVKMLLPSAGSMAIYDESAELVWCSDGYERPDLRALLDRERARETLIGRGRVETSDHGIPVFIAPLRAADARPLGSIVLELAASSGARTSSMVVSLLRPVLDCLERGLDLERSTLAADRNAGLELLLTVDERGEDDASALQELLRHCVGQLECVTGAVLVPDKNIEYCCTGDGSLGRSPLLDRTQKHLLAWAQLNNRPMIVNRGGAGAEAPYKILSCPLRDQNGRVAGLVAVFRASDAQDFDQRDVRILDFVTRKAVAILASERDPLTGLVNRFIFERRAQKLLDDATTASAALLYIDIDKITAVNEAFGLNAGDEVIQRVGQLVQRAAGAGLVSRLAGDRFAALLPGVSLDEAEKLGLALVEEAGQLGYVQGVETQPVAVSIGVVVGQGHTRLTHLLAAAELACKRAKRQGGGRLVMLKDAHEPLPSRTLMAAADIQEALAANRFEIEAQPMLGLRPRSEQLLGFELLVRLRNAVGDLLAPDKFLEACERYELLPALDRWVFCTAVDTLRAHAGVISASAQFFAVNVSAQSLASRTFAKFALDYLAAAGLSPAQFCFEIKESAVTSVADAEAFVREVAAAGCKVTLDDFGSGVSSLANLKRLPVDFIKIDGRFVRRIGNDRVAESIVSGIARAARTLGVTPVAEHVETAAVAERLCELDVTLGQGFHLGRPMPLGEVVEQLVAEPPVTRITTRA